MQPSLPVFLIFSALLLCGSPSHAASGNAELADRLRQGGYVLVMRHASSPANPPDAAHADAANKELERQLDDNGRATAIAMGRALKRLNIPIGKVYSSPTYRARQTVMLAGLPTPETVTALGDFGRSMARIQGPGPVQWLQAKVAEAPATGRNTLIVTHMPNIAAAFPDAAKDLQDGEALIFKPGGKGKAELVAAVPITDWPRMAP